LQTVTKTIALIEFQLNREEISKTLCVKRKIKNNKCHGACHLKKTLEQKDKQEQKLPSVLKEKTEVVLYCSSFTLVKTFKPYSQHPSPVSVSVPGQPIRFSVFHPPQFI
jgi:hypothetical protein